MAAPGALAILVALSTMTSAIVPSGAVDTSTARTNRVETVLHMPRLVLQAPATIPAAASPRLSQDQQRVADTEPDVDVTGPVN